MTPISHRHHYLPQGWQRAFADERGFVSAVAPDGRCFKTTPLNVGLKNDLYLRQRPSGETIDDIERISLGSVEGEAIPVLRELEARWPLSAREKLNLATFMGIQLVRGPRWFQWHESFAKTNYRESLDRGEFRKKSLEHGITEVEVYEAHVEAETAGTQRLLRMLSLGAKAGTVIGSMTWCLLRFPAPCLALADHPVVIWPLQAAGGRAPERAEPSSIGLLNMLEVRMPVAPDLALVAAWLDQPDISKPFIGRTHHARNLNAFSMVEAEHQWIHRPGRTPRGGAGPWLPMMPQLRSAYCYATARDSTIRRDLVTELNANIGNESREVRIRFIEPNTSGSAA